MPALKSLYTKKEFLAFLSLFFLFDQFITNKIYPTGRFYLCNEGISFGLAINKQVLIFSLFFLSLFFLYLYHKKYFSLDNTPQQLLLALILAGAFSNLTDRFRLGCIPDYLMLYPVNIFFNLADLEIFIGFLCLFVFFTPKPTSYCE